MTAETPLEMTLRHVDETARRLVRLLDDPHPGLATWLQGVGALIDDLADLRWAEDPTGDVGHLTRPAPLRESPEARMEIAKKAAGDWYYRFPAGRWPDAWKWLMSGRNSAREALEYAQGATDRPVVVVTYDEER